MSFFPKFEPLGRFWKIARRGLSGPVGHFFDTRRRRLPDGRHPTALRRHFQELSGPFLGSPSGAVGFETDGTPTAGFANWFFAVGFLGRRVSLFSFVNDRPSGAVRQPQVQNLTET